MSDYEFDLDLDVDTDSLYREGGELPADQLQPLVCGLGQLFSDALLEESEDDPSPDPASLPAPRSAEVKLALQSVRVESWVDNVEEQEAGELLESTDSEEQQDQEDQQDLLQSSGSSQRTVPMDGVEQVPLRSEPSGPVVDLEAQRKASLQSTLDCLSGKGSGP